MSHFTSIRMTSFESYKQLKPELKTRQCEILEFLKRQDEPLTDLEITVSMGYRDPNRVRPKRNELVKLGYVIEARAHPVSFPRFRVIRFGVRVLVGIRGIPRLACHKECMEMVVVEVE